MEKKVVQLKIIEQLRGNDLSQRWLADRARVHESQLSQIINGKLIPNHRQREAIARALRMRSDQIFV